MPYGALQRQSYLMHTHMVNVHGFGLRCGCADKLCHFYFHLLVMSPYCRATRSPDEWVSFARKNAGSGFKESNGFADIIVESVLTEIAEGEAANGSKLEIVADVWLIVHTGDALGPIAARTAFNSEHLQQTRESTTGYKRITSVA